MGKKKNDLESSETVEEFLARGGQIKKVEFGVLNARIGKVKSGARLKEKMERESIELGRINERDK